MRGPGGGNGKYAPVRASHERIDAERFDRGIREVTDSVAERRDAKIARVARDRFREMNRPQQEPVQREQGPALTLHPTGPAPGETQGHFVWRRAQTQRIERDRTREAAKAKDEIPRILRSETDLIRQNVEIRTVLDRREAERARHAQRHVYKRTEKAKKENEHDQEIEIE